LQIQVPFQAAGVPKELQRPTGQDPSRLGFLLSVHCYPVASSEHARLPETTNRRSFDKANNIP
jgi:hypothetical protein